MAGLSINERGSEGGSDPQELAGRESGLMKPNPCEVCRQIISIFEGLPEGMAGGKCVEQKRFSTAELTMTGCSKHLKLISGCLGRDLGPGTAIQYVVVMPRFIGAPHVTIFGHEDDTPSSTCVSGELRILSAFGQPADQSWIAQGLAREWKLRCEREHGSLCTAPAVVGRTDGTVILPNWVVDTWKQCLIPCSASTPYVALSYVWGGATSIVALESNIKSLQEPGKLGVDEGLGKSIPLTIRHAMSFVAMMGERYLWVDSLCIVQDDEKKMAEIMRMDAIYANATITITAMDGRHADAGLSGLEGISSPRSISQTIYPLQGDMQVIEIRGPDEMSGDQIYSTRGWTRQEYLLSRRRLMFNGGWLEWNCQRTTWREYPGDENPQSAVKLQRLIPNLPQLIEIAAKYSTLKLTFAEDSLVAFSGIASALSTSFRGGFISCLPAQLFHTALLWRPSGMTQRKVPKGDRERAILPSWSWAAWETDSPIRIHRIMDHIKDCPDGFTIPAVAERILPLVSWKRGDTAHGPWALIQDDWYEYKNLYWNRTDTPCPPGWTRHPFEGDWHRLTPSMRGRQPEFGIRSLCFYTHESEPECEFWYPPPPAEDEGVPVQQEHILSRYIACRTQRAYLVADDEMFEPRSAASGLRVGGLVSVRDLEGRWAGALQPDERKPGPTADTIAGLSRGSETLTKGHLQLELVEVARGNLLHNAYRLGAQSMLDYPEEYYWPERPHGEIYEYYYVMWIERQGNCGTDKTENEGEEQEREDAKVPTVVATRKGLGRIQKDVWERQELQWIDLVLA